MQRSSFFSRFVGQVWNYIIFFLWSWGQEKKQHIFYKFTKTIAIFNFQAFPKGFCALSLSLSLSIFSYFSLFIFLCLSLSLSLPFLFLFSSPKAGGTQKTSPKEVWNHSETPSCSPSPGCCCMSSGPRWLLYLYLSIYLFIYLSAL